MHIITLKKLDGLLPDKISYIAHGEGLPKSISGVALTKYGAIADLICCHPVELGIIVQEETDDKKVV